MREYLTARATRAQKSIEWLLENINPTSEGASIQRQALKTSVAKWRKEYVKAKQASAEDAGPG